MPVWEECFCQLHNGDVEGLARAALPVTGASLCPLALTGSGALSEPSLVPPRPRPGRLPGTGSLTVPPATVTRSPG